MPSFLNAGKVVYASQRPTMITRTLGIRPSWVQGPTPDIGVKTATYTDDGYDSLEEAEAVWALNTGFKRITLITTPNDHGQDTTGVRETTGKINETVKGRVPEQEPEPQLTSEVVMNQNRAKMKRKTNTKSEKDAAPKRGRFEKDFFKSVTAKPKQHVNADTRTHSIAMSQRNKPENTAETAGIEQIDDSDTGPARIEQTLSDISGDSYLIH